MDSPLTILYRDDHLVVIDKPAGLAVHRGWAPERDVAVTRVRDLVGTYVHLIHRLDRGTSGALLFALDPASARHLGDQFAAGTVYKRYLALVRGIPEPARMTIDYAIPNDENSTERVPAVSDVERLEILGRYALVSVEPRTGRMHQIRRHLKHISCPLIGDVRYGKGEHNRFFRERYGLHRLFLHATELRFIHPAHGGQITVESPLPPDLTETLARLRDDLSTGKLRPEATKR